MKIIEAIRNRRSIRSFHDKAIPGEAVNDLIEAIRWAPSAGNLQARHFYFVFKKDLRVRIASVSLGQMFIATAPLVVVACADYEAIGPYGRRGEELYVIQDVAVAIENLMLEAYELGLGSVWVGAFDEEGLSAVLGLPERLRPVAVVPVGYPAHRPSPPERFLRDKLVTVIK